MCLFTTCQAKNLLSTGWFVKLGMFFFMIMVMIRSVIIEAGGSSCLSNSTRIFLHSCITGESERATKQISVNNNKKKPKKITQHQMLWAHGCSTGKECSGSLPCETSNIVDCPVVYG